MIQNYYGNKVSQTGTVPLHVYIVGVLELSCLKAVVVKVERIILQPLPVMSNHLESFINLWGGLFLMLENSAALLTQKKRKENSAAILFFC